MAEKAVMDTESTNIDSILQEQRKFDPPTEFSHQAHVKSLAEYERLGRSDVKPPPPSDNWRLGRRPGSRRRRGL